VQFGKEIDKALKAAAEPIAAEKASGPYPQRHSYVEHTEGDGAAMFKAVCKLGLEEMVSKKLNATYRSGPSKTWIKVKESEGAGSNPSHGRDVLKRRRRL
jgi:ATP-dependent DNA ligase